MSYMSNCGIWCASDASLPLLLLFSLLASVDSVVTCAAHVGKEGCSLLASYYNEYSPKILRMSLDIHSSAY